MTAINATNTARKHLKAIVTLGGLNSQNDLYDQFARGVIRVTYPALNFNDILECFCSGFSAL